MATEGCLPLFHTGGDAGQDEVDLETILAQDPTLQNDHLLSELLRSEGEDLLSSLLEPTSAPSLLAPLDFDFTTSPLLSSQTANDGYASDQSIAQNTASPSSHSSVSDQWGESPSCVVSSTLPDSRPRLDVVQPSDISIDVDLIFRDAVSTLGAPTCQEPTGGGKAATVVLSEEEKTLLAQEGIELPVDMPLTKAEQKHLKRVRRKIKNKVSAQESRKRKKEYVQGLEQRVEQCTTINRELQRKVGALETENRSLLAQLQKLQVLVSQYNPSRMKTGSLVLVVILSFSLFLTPWLQPRNQQSGYQTIKAHSSRTLLFAETDEYGNVIDPETGQVISEAGGQSPLPAPPWVHQTPALHLLHRHSHDQKLRHDL